MATVLISVPRIGSAAPLAPAVAVEAEEFTIEKGWRVIRSGEGNYTVDIVGFCHFGGERLLQALADDDTAAAALDVTIPESGDYVLWARYEYPAFSETLFTVVVEQNGREMARKTMGARDADRLAFNDARLRPQYDPPWGPEGTAEEPMAVNGLQAGAARLRLLAAKQSGAAGVSANRNIDLIYLTRNTAPIMRDGAPNPDSWWAQGGGAGALYPILNVFRDTRGARWEAQISNRSDKNISVIAQHIYNRTPWGAGEQLCQDLAPGAASAWLPLTKQDTAHFSMTAFTAGGDFTIQLRPVGGAPAGTWNSEGGTARLYIPPYARWGEKPYTPVEAIDATLEHLAKIPAPGKNPTLPLAYGGWMAVDKPGIYGQKYCDLYKAIGMRAIPSTDQSKEVMERMGLPLTKSAQSMLYRQYPTPENIAKAKELFEKNGLLPYLRYFDYGDEIHFSEWLNPALQGRHDQLPQLWREWYAKNRPGQQLPAETPDSSAAAASANPRLFVDSTIFYEDLALAWVAAGNRAVKAALGADVYCGANYAAHPFYYPSATMYVHWFRRGAADWGRHSEYFWQVCQPGPMINGYIAEHFRAGMRDNPRAVNRQYTMPHSPGNTEASFMRTAFSHLAHGAKELDYFGIGMNECFTENHIDHRDHDRYRQIRDINYSLGFVEDIWTQAKMEPAETAILLSESTERWDLAQIAQDKAGHDVFGENFRKTRLSYHMERVGLWQALTFAGASPDLLVEEDLTDKRLRGYRLLFVVGDSLPLAATKPLEQFVRAGGTVVATAGVGRYGTYREPNPALQELLGITERKLEEREIFLRPLQELQFCKPLGAIKAGDWEFPVLAVSETITAPQAQVLAVRQDDGSPAVIRRQLGKGSVTYIAALPGVAYIWSALQPPRVADRGANTHQVVENFDKGVTALIAQLLATAGVKPPIQNNGRLLDARLLRSGKNYILPLANYNSVVGDDTTIALRLDGKVKAVSSAYRGELPFTMVDGLVQFTIPKLGYGDILRLEMR